MTIGVGMGSMAFYRFVKVRNTRTGCIFDHRGRNTRGLIELKRFDEILAISFGPTVDVLDALFEGRPVCDDAPVANKLCNH